MGRVYFGFDTHVDPLLIGCFLALAPLAKFQSLAHRFSLSPILILIVMALTLFWDSRVLCPFGFALTGLCAAWIVLAALVGPPQGSLRRFLRLAPLNYCGRISYGLYLWHYPVLRVLAGHSSGSHFNQAKIFAITAISTFLIASASYHMLELPVLKQRRQIQ